MLFQLVINCTIVYHLSCLAYNVYWLLPLTDGSLIDQWCSAVKIASSSSSILCYVEQLNAFGHFRSAIDGEEEGFYWNGGGGRRLIRKPLSKNIQTTSRGRVQRHDQQWSPPLHCRLNWRDAIFSVFLFSLFHMFSMDAIEKLWPYAKYPARPIRIIVMSRLMGAHYYKGHPLLAAAGRRVSPTTRRRPSGSREMSSFEKWMECDTREAVPAHKSWIGCCCTQDQRMQMTYGTNLINTTGTDVAYSWEKSQVRRSANRVQCGSTMG